MPCRYMQPRRLDVMRRVVEKDIRAERVEERAFVASAEEQRFVDAHAPFAQRQDHALVRGRGAGGDERGANWRAFARKRVLQAMQRVEKAAEWAAGQRLAHAL